MSAQPQISAMLPGVHRVSKQLAGGRVAEYWYAWRGGPRILAASANNVPALAREVAKLTPAAITAYQQHQVRAPDTVSFYGLVTRYLAALEADSKLSPRTKADRRKYLDVARTDLGTMEVRAFESRRARGHLIQWRDSYAATPKSADERLGAVSAVLDRKSVV